MGRPLKILLLIVPIALMLAVCVDTPYHRLSQGRLTGVELESRLPVYPEFLPRVVKRTGLLRDRVLAAAGEDGYARRAA